MDPITFTIEGVAAKVLRNLYEQYFQTDTAPNSTLKQINVGGEQRTIEHTTKVVKPIFGSYVTRNTEFAEYINDLRDLVQVYINKKKCDRPLNILLAAPPGSGKSFLIKQIIKTLENLDNKSFEEVYVAALDEINELYGIFQRVQSLNLEGKLPFVFFDEVDSKISDEHVYAKFLAPMWDGTFYIGKEKFYLGKCVFFFAGSTLSVETESDRILESNSIKSERMQYKDYFEKWLKAFKDTLDEDRAKSLKMPDFVDRIDYVLRIPPVHQALLGNELDLEHEDLACVLIKKHFPKVELLDKRALLAIVRLLATATSRRSAEKAVFAATPSKDTIFDFDCLPRRDKEQFTAYISGLNNPDNIFERTKSEYYRLKIG